jgi:hypothetical protein
MGDRSLATHTLEYTGTETTKICIHITNGIRKLDLGVRAAEDRTLVHAVDTATVSKVVCMHAVQGNGGVPPLILDFGSGQTSRDYGGKKLL